MPEMSVPVRIPTILADVHVPTRVEDGIPVADVTPPRRDSGGVKDGLMLEANQAAQAVLAPAKPYRLFSSECHGLDIDLRHVNPPFVRLKLAADFTDAAKLAPLLEAREKRLAALREGFERLKQQHQASEEARLVRQLREKLAAAEKAEQDARTAASTSTTLWRQAIRKGEDPSAHEGAVDEANTSITRSQLLAGLLRAELQEAEAAYDQAWLDRRDAFVAAHQAEAHQRAEQLEADLVAHAALVAAELEGERAAATEVGSGFFTRAEVPELAAADRE